MGIGPKKSAKEALGVARQRCWQHDWVLDLDIKSFFETIDHRLLMRAVRRQTTCPWVRLYIQRWLTAPTQLADGSIIQRSEGTPQGGVVSPLLANLYLHYAFDLWMGREFPLIPFERYADDVICHCRTKQEAVQLKESIAHRFSTCNLELHPKKTLVAYCKDGRRTLTHPDIQFNFLGYTFRPRLVKGPKGNVFLGFTPAISSQAAKLIRQTMRSWKLGRRSDLSISDIARRINPAIRGWINYYGSYYRSALTPVFEHLDACLTRWAMRKFKDMRRHPARGREWISRLRSRAPDLFAHWTLLQPAVR